MSALKHAHFERLLESPRTVVYFREYVGMNVDHRNAFRVLRFAFEVPAPASTVRFELDNVKRKTQNVRRKT